MTHNPVSTAVIREIQRKREKLRDQSSRLSFHLSLPSSDSFHLISSRFYRGSLEKEAALHSYQIEHPNGNGNEFSLPTGSKETRKGTKRLIRALNWGVSHFSLEDIDGEYIKTLAYMIDPKFHNRGAEYRKLGKHLTGVRPLGASWTPPEPSKVPLDMERFIRGLKEMLLRSGEEIPYESIKRAIGAAAYAHLHLVRIHPFEDTNGRTARTLQNIILKTNDLLPPVIYPGERQDYYEHLDRAINDWRVRTGTSDVSHDFLGEDSFYNYIAGKISASFDILLRRYQ